MYLVLEILRTLTAFRNARKFDNRILCENEIFIQKGARYARKNTLKIAIGSFESPANLCNVT